MLDDFDKIKEELKSMRKPGVFIYVGYIGKVLVAATKEFGAST